MILLRVAPLLFLLLLPWGTAQAPTPGSIARNEGRGDLPTNGVISVNKGVVTFVQGQLVVRLEYQIKSFLVRSAANLYDRASQLTQTLAKVALSEAHQVAVFDAIHSMSYYFRMLISRTGDQVLRRLNYISIREMEQDWRRKLARTKEQMSQRATTQRPSPSEIPKMTSPIPRSQIRHENGSARANGRKKRGLLNLGGDLLKTVLGVATEKDVEDLKQHFADVNQGVITSLQKINLNFNHISATLNTLVDQAQASAQLLDRMHQDLNELDTYITVINSVMNIREGIDYLLLVSIDAEDKLSLLRLGSVPTVVAYDELRTLINEGIELFQNAYVFPFHMTPINYTNVLAKLELKPLPEEETFALILPFVTRSNMTMFSLKNFPMLNPETNQTVLIKGLKPVVAIARDGKTYAENIDFNMCKELAGVHVCPPGTVMNVDANPSCSVESVLGLNKTHCVLEHVNITSVLSRQLGYVCYLYVPRREWANLDCHDKSFSPTYIELHGAYALHAPCSLTTPSFSVATVRHAYVTLNSKRLESLPMATFRLPVSGPLSHITHLSSELTRLKASLNSTADVVDVLTSVATVRHHYTMGSVTLVAVALVLSVVAYMLYKLPQCRRRPKMRVSFTPPSSRPLIQRTDFSPPRPMFRVMPPAPQYLFPLDVAPPKPVRSVLTRINSCPADSEDGDASGTATPAKGGRGQPTSQGATKFENELITTPPHNDSTQCEDRPPDGSKASEHSCLPPPQAAEETTYDVIEDVTTPSAEALVPATGTM